MQIDLTGKRVLVTGGNSGLGAAMVRAFGAAGATTVFIDGGMTDYLGFMHGSCPGVSASPVHRAFAGDSGPSARIGLPAAAVLITHSAMAATARATGRAPTTPGRRQASKS